jgi:acyl-CoA reductase-like NAD-dependent aldehyde dehydrogenase
MTVLLRCSVIPLRFIPAFVFYGTIIPIIYRQQPFMSLETEPIYVNSPESLNAMMERVKSAQRIYANYTQEKVDEIFRAAALAAASNRIPLAKAAVEETRMGIVEDKVIKNHFASEYIYNKFHAEKTCGLIEPTKAGMERSAMTVVSLIIVPLILSF